MFSILFLNNDFIYAEESSVKFFNNGEHEIYFLFSIAYLMGGSSIDFFETYRSELSGVSKEFRLSPSISFGVIYDISGNSTISLIGEMNRAYINDNYDEIITAGHTGSRNITQNFEIVNFPITVNFKYHPVISTYYTYIMVGIGAAHNHIKWEESVYSSIQDDIRKGGLHFCKNLIIPLIRLSSGIELQFDQKSEKNFLRSFFFDFYFNYFFRSADIFAKVVNQFYYQKEGLKKNYTILPYYFGLNIGFNFNLNFVN